LQSTADFQDYLLLVLMVVLIRIVKPMAGVMDGQRLAQYTPGLTYEVIEPLARQFVAMGTAVQDRSSDPALIVAADEESSLDEAIFTGGIHVSPAQGIAADRPQRRTRLKRSR
jgi:hypothetical protein